MHCNGSKPCQVRIKTQHSVRKKGVGKPITHQLFASKAGGGNFTRSLYSKDLFQNNGAVSAVYNNASAPLV